MFNLEGEDTITFNRNLFLPNGSDNSSSRDWNAVYSTDNYESANNSSELLYTDRRSVLYQVDSSSSANTYHYTYSIYDGGGAVTDSTSTLRAVGKDYYRGIPRTSVAFSDRYIYCLLYTSPSPRDRTRSRMPSSA